MVQHDVEVASHHTTTLPLPTTPTTPTTTSNHIKERNLPNGSKGKRMSKPPDRPNTELQGEALDALLQEEHGDEQPKELAGEAGEAVDVA